ISALDRVRGRAAQDRDRQDPALQAARLTNLHGGSWRMFDPALESLPPAAFRTLQWRCFKHLADEALGANGHGNAFLREKWGEAGVRSAQDLGGWGDFLRLPF